MKAEACRQWLGACVDNRDFCAQAGSAQPVLDLQRKVEWVVFTCSRASLQRQGDAVGRQVQNLKDAGPCKPVGGHGKWLALTLDSIQGHRADDRKQHRRAVVPPDRVTMPDQLDAVRRAQGLDFCTSEGDPY